MEKSGTQESIKVELTKAEFDFIICAIVLASETLRGDIDKIPETVMTVRLGTRVGIFSFNTIHELARKLKALLKE